MKTIKYEVKLERSVKIILGTLALGIFLNAFQTPISYLWDENGKYVAGP